MQLYRVLQFSELDASLAASFLPQAEWPGDAAVAVILRTVMDGDHEEYGVVDDDVNIDDAGGV